MKKRPNKIIYIILLVALLFGGIQYFKKFDNYRYEQVGSFPLPKPKPSWERKIFTSQVLKVGLITDSHVHANRLDKTNKSPESKRYLSEKHRAALEEFGAQMEIFGPEVNVFLGDIIEGTGEKTHAGIQGLQLAKKIVEKNNIQTLYLVGNHDLRSVTKEEFREALKIDYLNESFDLGDYRFVLLDASNNLEGLDTTPNNNKHIPGYLKLETLIWLEEQLQTDKHVFVFIHQAAFDRKLPEEKRNKASITNALDLRFLLEKYNVTAIFNGHIEVRHYEEREGVKYYSLTGTSKSKTYPGSFYELTINSGQPNVTMFYANEHGDREYTSVDFEDPNTYLPIKKKE